MKKSNKSIKVYRVRTPSGVIADGTWKSIEEIPERIPDRFNHYFFPSETEIMAIDISQEEFDRLF